MSANVESMFYVREKPWHGLGTRVDEAPTSIDALVLAGLDWQVNQKNVYTQDGNIIPGYKANIRGTDDSALGIVSDKYKVVQNEDAFQFTDPASTISKHTHYIIMDSKAGNKLDKARALGVAILSECDFERMAEGDEHEDQ